MIEAGAGTIEPMLCLGTYEWDMWEDDWTVVTEIRGSAQFEHTLLVTDDGAEILTLPEAVPSRPTATPGPSASGTGERPCRSAPCAPSWSQET